MSDDTASRKPRRTTRRTRVLVVSNASPETSSDEGVASQVPPKPRPLPSPSHSLATAEAYGPYRNGSTPTSFPTPLNTTGIPSHRSNQSNPALSSPSSTSSPAVESTPPPSTPGLGGYSIPSNEEGTFRQGMLGPIVGQDRTDHTPQVSRPQRQHFVGQSHERRYSSGGSRPATSPTVSTTSDSYIPSRYRPSPNQKVIVLVTTDAENLHIVDITGAMTPAFIRERIFTKLQISDEDQSKYSIYRTEINRFAMGNALTDEELFDLYKERGDDNGSLKLLVSHSHASVHEPTYEDIPTSMVNTIPPPVLPGTIYAPLQPNRKGRIRQDSQSSTSEPHHAEVGYEASVSDDLDHGDMDGSRDPKDYGRPTIHGRALPPRPSSPSGYHRSRSPCRILSPERSIARPSPYPADIGACPMPGTSPQTSRFDLSHPLPPLPMDAHTPVSATSADRERTYTNDGQPSSYPDRWRVAKEQDKERDRRRRVGDSRKDVGRYPRGPEQEAVESKQQRDPWTIVPRDVPSSDYGKDRPTTPQEGRTTGRFPPSISPLNLRSGSGGSGESSRSRKKNNMVPTNWPVNWKHTMGPVSKTDHKLVVSSAPSPSLIRLGAKSMTDMRGAYKVPASLQPGRISRVPLPPPLPVTPRPLTSSSASGVPPLPSASSTGDPLSAHTEVSPSPALSAGYMRPTPTSYASSTATNGYLGSPAQDPYPRPHSALGESGSLPFTQPRHMHSPQNSESSYDPSLLQRVPPPLSTGSGTSVPFYQNRDTVMRARLPHSFDDQNLDVCTSAPDIPFRGPRTPPRSPVSTSTTTFMPGTSAPLPSCMPTDPPGTAFSIRGAIDEDASSHTARADALTWLEGFIDENAAEGTARPRPRLQPPVQQLPTPPPTTEIATLSSSSVATLIETLNGSRHHDDDSDSDSEGGTIWAKKPKKPAEASQSNLPLPRSNGRPPLTPLVFPPAEPNTPGDVEFGRSPPPGFPAPPDFMPPPRTPRRTPAITHSSKKLKDRISKFDNNFDMTWAPRPPPEVMYDRLEEYFPEHDLDKPVIDAPSGGTSPTATEAPAVPVSQRFKHKKSIRVVAAEHKRQMDRTSRGDDSTVAPLSRKRHTKLWGSKLEEVTTEQGKGPLSSTSDQSPGGGAKPIFRWVRGELIGKGTYGRVYLALNATTGEMIAVKQVEIPRTASDKVDTRQVSVVEALKLESETLKDLDHPHIVQYLGFEETPSFLSIFLEYVPGGSIASCLRKHGRFDEEVTKSFTGQILSGLEYLHSRNILHRDLKADNILVETSGVCKISDFGISKRTDDINMAAAYTSMQGTVFWMAPEVVNSKGKGYNSKIDIWSLGCVVFEMWTGQRPWSGQEAMAVLLHLYNTKQAPPVPDGIKLSPLADDLRLKCFAADPDERPTAAELRKHSYLELQPGWSFNGFK